MQYWCFDVFQILAMSVHFYHTNIFASKIDNFAKAGSQAHYAWHYKHLFTEHSSNKAFMRDLVCHNKNILFKTCYSFELLISWTIEYIWVTWHSAKYINERLKNERLPSDWYFLRKTIIPHTKTQSHPY